MACPLGVRTNRVPLYFVYTVQIHWLSPKPYFLNNDQIKTLIYSIALTHLKLVIEHTDRKQLFAPVDVNWFSLQISI